MRIEVQNRLPACGPRKKLWTLKASSSELAQRSDSPNLEEGRKRDSSNREENVPTLKLIL
jgi:hypothetical protein